MKSGEENGIPYSEDGDLAAQFLDWTDGAIKELRQILENIKKPVPRCDDAMQRFYDLCHNIKGMGASFDYHLLTAIGTSLCAYMKTLAENDQVNGRVLEAHIRAFEVVSKHRITGDGGSQGDALRLRLQTIIQEES